MARFQAPKGKALFFLFFLWFLWFINFTVRTIFSPLLPHIEDEFLVSHAQASSIFPVTSMGYSISLFFSTFFSGLLGVKKAIGLSLLFAGSSAICIGFAGSLSVLYVLVFLLGLGIGLYLPNAIPVMTDCFPERYWGRVLSIHETAPSISIFAAPVLVFSLLSITNWRGILQLLGSVCVVCGILFFFAGHDVKAARSTSLLRFDLFRNRSVWIIGIIWVFASGCGLGLYFVTPLYLIKELGMAEGEANTLLSLSRLGGILAAIGAGLAVDHFSVRKTAAFMVFATGLSTMGLAITAPSWIKADLFIQGALSTAFFPLALVTISKMFGAESRGQATGFIVMLGVMFGVGIGPYLLGVSGDLISFRVGIVVLGFCTAASSFLLTTLKELR